MQPDANQNNPIEVLMRAAGFFLAGMLLIKTMIPSGNTALEPMSYIIFGIGAAVSAFGFVLAFSTIQIPRLRIFANWVNRFSIQLSPTLFAATSVSIVKNIVDFRDLELLRIISWFFLVLFVVLVLLASRDVLKKPRLTMLFTLSMVIFSLILVLTEQLNKLQLSVLLSLILLSSLRLQFLLNRRDNTGMNG